MEWIKEAIGWFLDLIGDMFVGIINWIYGIIFGLFPAIIVAILSCTMAIGIFYVIYLIFSKIGKTLDKGIKSSSKFIKYISKICIGLILLIAVLLFLVLLGFMFRSLYLDFGIWFIPIFLIIIFLYYIQNKR